MRWLIWFMSPSLSTVPAHLSSSLLSSERSLLPALLSSSCPHSHYIHQHKGLEKSSTPAHYADISLILQCCALSPSTGVQPRLVCLLFSLLFCKTKQGMCLHWPPCCDVKLHPHTINESNILKSYKDRVWRHLKLDLRKQSIGSRTEIYIQVEVFS